MCHTPAPVPFPPVFKTGKQKPKPHQRSGLQPHLASSLFLFLSLSLSLSLSSRSSFARDSVTRLIRKNIGKDQRQIHPNGSIPLTTIAIMEGPEGDFNGFGKGFAGFPKRLPEDCVDYSLFIIDAKIKSQRELLSSLEAIRKEALKFTEGLLKEYIWHRDPFRLNVESGKGMDPSIFNI